MMMLCRQMVAPIALMTFASASFGQRAAIEVPMPPSHSVRALSGPTLLCTQTFSLPISVGEDVFVDKTDKTHTFYQISHGAETLLTITSYNTSEASEEALRSHRPRPKVQFDLPRLRRDLKTFRMASGFTVLGQKGYDYDLVAPSRTDTYHISIGTTHYPDSVLQSKIENFTIGSKMQRNCTINS